MSCRSTSGSAVSTTLARQATKLSDKTIQSLFHELKREGDGLPTPSEQDMVGWRDRQQTLISRNPSASPTKQDALRAKLFRSRSEPVPDGGTFYAQNHIEDRARQEVAIRAAPNVIDLAPPGSQAAQYELGADGRPAKVWYASYGSNLNRNRFLAYLQGGKPEGSSRTYDGADDKSPPEADIAMRFAGRPHFALSSAVWGGGIAFMDTDATDAAALGRAYKISTGAFDAVIAQENGLPGAAAAPVPLDEVLKTGRSVTGPGAYQTLVHVGDYDGAPVLTFTAPFTSRQALLRTGTVQRGIGSVPVRTSTPSESYVQMIGSGLKETFGMSEVAQADYLRGSPGGSNWARADLVHVLRGGTMQPAAPLVPPRTFTPGASAAYVPTGSMLGSGAKKPSLAVAFSALNAQPADPVRLPQAKPNGEYFPRVKVYATIDEQREGVSAWQGQQAKYEERLNQAKAADVDASMHLNYLRHVQAPTTRLNDAAAEHAMTSKNAKVLLEARNEVRRKTRLAEKQTASTFYSEPTSRTEQQWMELGASVVTARAAALTNAATADRLAGNAARTTTNASLIAKTQARAVQAQKNLVEMQSRLNEIHANLDVISPRST